MIIPYTHDDLEARRWPLVTLALIAMNVLCFLALDFAMRGRLAVINDVAERVVTYRDMHPSLTSPHCAPIDDAPRARRRPPPHASREVLPSPIPSLGTVKGDRPAFDGWRAAEREAEQTAFDDLCKKLEGEVADLPTFRFGYVPEKNDVIGLLTYQFLHGGWLHLLSNLWFLWLCGCNLEDRWGRAVFVPFYLTAGIVAALTQKMFTPHSEIPLIGASGSIAGAMGGFLVAHATTRIRFFYVFFLFRWGTFSAPAFVMLPLWLLTEILWGMVGGSGVAHWAHVGGFVYGAAFAFVLRFSGVERKLDLALEAKVTRAQDPRILKAGDMITAGDAKGAMPILDRMALEQPRNIDVQLELLRAAKAAADPARELAAYGKLIELYFDGGFPDTAADLFIEMHGFGLHGDLTRGWTLKVADHFVARAMLDRADKAYVAACKEGLIDVTAVHATLAHARVLRRMGKVGEARRLFAAARESPFSTAEIDAVIDGELARLGSVG